MYQLDGNYLDQRYFLRPIDDNEEWIVSEKKLQLILRKAADICYEQKAITKDERDEFHISGIQKKISIRKTKTKSYIYFSDSTRNLSCIKK